MEVQGFQREKELNKEAYYSEGYFEKYQLFSLSEQINLIYQYSTTEAKILEIGKGNGFVSDFFKKAGFIFDTFDINKNLEPDVVGNILELEELVVENYDLIACCEVLEHMDFKYFEKSLEQMQKITNKYIVLTLPNCQKNFGMNLQIRLPKRKVFSLPLFFHTLIGKNICPEHFWEINYTKETSQKNIENILLKYFTIKDKGYFHTNPYHNFYILEKI
jgi:2-polyprenyl-3-methyl-5-hydroxy-6-metoxy-1,4-benzoquinol methylase